MHPIIVGIDPGTTTAFAALSFDFKVLNIRSKKEYSMAGILADIYKVGMPLIVGTDKKEVPSFIKEFSQKTGAKIFTPSYDTKKGEKLHVVKQAGLYGFVNNTHEIDALASAIYAYNDYKNLIDKINRYIAKSSRYEIKDKLISKVISNEISISKAVSEIDAKPVKKEPVLKKIPLANREPSKEEKEIMLLNSALEKLKSKISVLEEENLVLKNKRIDIGKETKKLISFKESRALQLEKQNKELKKNLESKENIIKKLDSFIANSKDKVLIKKLNTLSNEEYIPKKESLNIRKGDILLIEDISISGNAVVDDLSKYIRLIIYGKGTNKGLSDKFILIRKQDLDLIETKYYALADPKKIDTEAAKQDKKNKEYLKKILEEYKKERILDYVD